ncbi:Uncharacterised protein [Shigella sonnei]|nr:Uncharacterised protein [Shigella sonnei]
MKNTALLQCRYLAPSRPGRQKDFDGQPFIGIFSQCIQQLNTFRLTQISHFTLVNLHSFKALNGVIVKKMAG